MEKGSTRVTRYQVNTATHGHFRNIKSVVCAVLVPSIRGVMEIKARAMMSKSANDAESEMRAMQIFYLIYPS